VPNILIILSFSPDSNAPMMIPKVEIGGDFINGSGPDQLK
jgi:hypothetical protein